MLLHTSEQHESRTLTIVGASVAIACVAIAVFIYTVHPFGGRPQGQISVAFNTPFIGQGVKAGTPLVLHGVPVGEVTNVASLTGGGVSIGTDLQSKATAGLTDTLELDFRPVNYFGVTGINLKGGKGGLPLHDGMRVNAVPKGNFALQALLERLGQTTEGVITPQLIHVLDWGTRYTDALNPLVETMLIAAKAVSNVQTVPSRQLLLNATGISVAFPALVNSLIDTGQYAIKSNNYMQWGLLECSQDEYVRLMQPSIIEAEQGVFGSVGRLLSTHSTDLFNVTQIVKILFDPLPALIRPQETSHLIAEMRTRFEKMYAGTPDQRALNVKIVLDKLPGIASVGGLQ